MSRSIHQTLKSVFGGKSKEEIERMIEEEYPDLMDLISKSHIMQKVKEKRELIAFLNKMGISTPDILNNNDD